MGGRPREALRAMIPRLPVVERRIYKNPFTSSASFPFSKTKDCPERGFLPPLFPAHRSGVGIHLWQQELQQQKALLSVWRRHSSMQTSVSSSSAAERKKKPLSPNETEHHQQSAATPALSTRDTASSPLTEQEAPFKDAEAKRLRQRLAEDAARSQRLWDLLVPDKNMSFFSPAFWLLLLAVIILHLYNNEKERQQAQLGAVLSAEETRQRMLAEGARMRRQQQHQQEIRDQQP